MPSVLLVDDRPAATGLAPKSLGRSISLSIRHPAKVDASDLRTADLVLLDWDLNEWEGRIKEDELAAWPDDGLALAAILRSHVTRLGKVRPTAFALQSSYLGKPAGDLPPDY